jgi:hypothetical protein
MKARIENGSMLLQSTNLFRKENPVGASNLLLLFGGSLPNTPEISTGRSYRKYVFAVNLS